MCSRQARALIAGICLVVLLATVTLLVQPSLAAPRQQVVQPGDITTPTPTYEVILVPTATPMPTPLPSTIAPPIAQPSAAPHVPAANPNVGLQTYAVKEGDTLLTIAIEVGVDVEQMPCLVAPDFAPEQPLVIGMELTLLPAGWLCHQVAAGETLATIAAQYGLTSAAIYGVPWNGLLGLPPADVQLVVGSYLQIPVQLQPEDADGFLTFMLDQPLDVSPLAAYAIGGPQARRSEAIGPLPQNWPYGSGLFMWPVHGWLTQGYRDDHRAVDIAAPTGTFVAASDRGVVIRAGWNDQGYGRFVVVDHNIDYVTLYSHLDQVLVKEGEVVAQGQIIGTVGSTGNSTGPHLHFEIRDFGSRVNPLGLLVQ